MRETSINGDTEKTPLLTEQDKKTLRQAFVEKLGEVAGSRSFKAFILWYNTVALVGLNAQGLLNAFSSTAEGWPTFSEEIAPFVPYATLGVCLAAILDDMAEKYGNERFKKLRVLFIRATNDAASTFLYALFAAIAVDVYVDEGNSSGSDNVPLSEFLKILIAPTVLALFRYVHSYMSNMKLLDSETPSNFVKFMLKSAILLGAVDNAFTMAAMPDLLGLDMSNLTILIRYASALGLSAGLAGLNMKLGERFQDWSDKTLLTFSSAYYAWLMVEGTTTVPQTIVQSVGWALMAAGSYLGYYFSPPPERPIEAPVVRALPVKSSNDLADAVPSFENSIGPSWCDFFNPFRRQTVSPDNSLRASEQSHQMH